MDIKKMTSNLAIIAVLLVGTNQYFLTQIASANSGGSKVGSKLQIRDSASESEIVAAILPSEQDTVRPYEWEGQAVTLSAQVPNNGYDKLVAMNKVQFTTAEQENRFKDLSQNIYHPCCDAPLSSCGCKHSVAAKGLVKYLLTENYTDDQIKEEVFLWNRYWWPKHYATAAVYLKSQGVNPADIGTTEWLGSKLSTVRSGRKMKASLGI